MERNIEEIKQIDMVGYLSQLGHEPQKIKGNNYWYICPFQGERTASFKINRRLNRWYHFALGKGGSIIDIGMLYFNCTIAEFLRRFEQLDQRAFSAITNKREIIVHPENPVIVKNISKLTSYALLSYLQERAISIPTSKRFCKQVTFSIGQKEYYAIGFENQQGGFELRNRFMKVASAPKAVTMISHFSSSLKVLEGFTDFLSFVEYTPKEDFELHDYLVMNSTAFLEAALDIAGTYRTRTLFFDNDPTRQKCSVVPGLSNSKEYKEWPLDVVQHHRLMALKDKNDRIL